VAADKRAARLGVLALVATLLFGAVGARLWFLQTVQADSLQRSVDARKTKVIQLVPERGRIFDTDGRILADNARVLTVAVEWDVIRDDTDRAEMFTRLSGWLQVSVEDMESRYDSNTYSRYRPLPLKEDVEEPIAIALEERVEDFPGITIVTEWRRTYPYAPLASHVLGYLGAITAEDEQYYKDRGYDTSVGGEDVGRAGIELSMENVLHGQWGEEVVEVDANNRVVRTISYQPPVNGRDVQLSIDLDLQQYAERLLQTQLQLRRQESAANPMVSRFLDDGTEVREPLSSSLPAGARVNYKAPAGSVTVMDQHTGQILAMASYPTFDNRWFSADVDSDQFEDLFPQGEDEDPDDAVLPNRAIQGQYNLGSSFKPFTAYAALATGLLGPDTVYNDTGTYELTEQSVGAEARAAGAKVEYRNAICSFNNRPCVYGPINTPTALAVSSDAFFYKLGEEFYLAPGTQFQDQVRKFGLGGDTGIDLPYEFDGRIPTNELKRQLLEAGVLDASETPNLQPGDLVQMSVGQGLLAATPLQIAVGYAAIANGGRVLTPHAVQAVYEPAVPDGQPGRAALNRGTVARTMKSKWRKIPMTAGMRDPIMEGLHQNILGVGANGRSTTAGELFAVGYPESAIPIGGKTGTAQGAGNYPWNDSSVFAAVSLDPARPFTVVSYLEKSGYGSRGAAPVVKCMYLALSGITPLDPVDVSEPLDPDSTEPAQPAAPVDTACMATTGVPESRPVD
jgi:penicillin-binding protein 2